MNITKWLEDHTEECGKIPKEAVEELLKDLQGELSNIVTFYTPVSSSKLDKLPDSTLCKVERLNVSKEVS